MQGLGSWHGELDTSMGRWYRSKDSVSGASPHFGYLANKKWPLNEDITKHLLYFAQVRDCSASTIVYIIFDIGCFTRLVSLVRRPKCPTKMSPRS